MSSSRYQSRVLRFVAQQSMRVRDRALHGVRQMRLALTWGTQMVLYPVYVLFQSARLVGQQLEQATQRVFPALTAAIDPDASPGSPLDTQLPPQADRPIEHLLDILAQLAVPLPESPSVPPVIGNGVQASTSANAPLALAPGAPPPSFTKGHSDPFTAEQLGFLLVEQVSFVPNTTPNTTPNTPNDQASNIHRPAFPASLPLPSIQGVATLLHEKQIVLVDHQNTTHNVLTADQQAYLQQRIVLEVAEYWRDRRQYLMLAASTNSPLSQRFLPIPQERETMLLPVRYMRRFIGWMQQGPVAIATNLFQESALVPTPSPHIQMANGAAGYDPRGYGSSPSLSLHSIPMRSGSAAVPVPFMGQLLEPAPSRPSPLSPLPIPPPSVIPGAAVPRPLYPLPPSMIASRGIGDAIGNVIGEISVLPPASHPSTSLRPVSLPSFPVTAPTAQFSIPNPPRSRQSLWNKLLNWIVTMTDESKADRIKPDRNPDRFNTRYFNVNQLKVAHNGQIAPHLIANLQPPPLPLPPELVQDFWFDPDHQGSVEGWFNANQMNQVRRQREFPPVVPSLPARVAPPMMQSPALGASYAHIEAYLNEIKSGGLITTQLPKTISEDDVAQVNPFPESAASMLNPTNGGLPDPIAMEHYLAHHGVAYDFRRIEDPLVDRAFLYQVPGETRMEDASVEATSEQYFSLDIPDYGRSDVTTTLLEATAEVVGYEQHPLERVLGWIDAGMAWVEGQLIYIWHWVRDRF